MSAIKGASQNLSSPAISRDVSGLQDILSTLGKTHNINTNDKPAAVSENQKIDISLMARQEFTATAKNVCEIA